ncbi:hypothetical protein FQZ97_708430 [compost metagenome]
MQAHLLGQLHVGADAHGHHHEVGRDLGAVLEADGLHAAIVSTDEVLRLRAHEELQAPVFQRLLQQLARHVVQLALHEPGHHVHHRHGHAAQHQAVGGFEPEQAAADDHCVLVRARGLDHVVGVGDVAVGDHALQVLAGHGQHEGVGAGAHQQAVVGRLGAIFRAHDAVHAVDLDHLLAGVQRDVVVRVPLPAVEHDLVHRLLAREHGRQQDAVVVGVRLGAEDGDVVQVGRDLQQLFERAHAGHAVADHHEFHFLHGAGPFREINRTTARGARSESRHEL